MNVQKKRSRRSVIALPDDVVMEILSRMPALDVLKCRRVCRRWRDLISTQNFSEMHLKAKAHHSSMILVQRFVPIKEKGALLLLDKWEKPRKRRIIRRARPNFIDNSGSGFLDVHLCYDGLIVMTSKERLNGLSFFTIFNPISRDAVRVETPNRAFNVYAMFFNTVIKEYCVLFGKYGSESDVEFRMLNLGTQPSFRALKQPVSFWHQPRSPFCEHPVVIDDATIYWLIEGWSNHSSCKELIMSFDIQTEKFTFMPHPGSLHDCQGLHSDMHIFKNDGRLSLAQSKIAPKESLLIINTWTLRDSDARLWIKTHHVSINISTYIDRLEGFLGFTVMAVGSGELLLHYSDYESDDYRVYAYDFELGTLRKIGTYQDSQISIFVPSFVSLKNCKPKICI